MFIDNELKCLFKEIICDLHIKAYDDLEIVGEGYDGVVYRINDDYCIKVDKNNISSTISIHLIKPCANICVPIKKYSSMHGKYSASIQKYINGESLQSLIKNKNPLSEKEVIPIIHDLLKGLNALHSVGLVHRDFHPGNVLFDYSGNMKKAVIIDIDGALPFGEKIGPCFLYNGYQAPEIVLNNEAFDDKSEVFSIGVIMYELLFGECKFGGYDFFGKIVDQSWKAYQNNSLYYNEQVKKAIRLLPNEIQSATMLSTQCYSLLTCLLDPDKDKRISTAIALRHPAFNHAFN